VSCFVLDCVTARRPTPPAYSAGLQRGLGRSRTGCRLLCLRSFRKSFGTLHLTTPPRSELLLREILIARCAERPHACACCSWAVACFRVVVASNFRFLGPLHASVLLLPAIFVLFCVFHGLQLTPQRNGRRLAALPPEDLRFAILAKERVLEVAATHGLALTAAQAAPLATGWDVDNFVRNSKFRSTSAAHKAAAAAYDKAVRALPAQPEPDAHLAIVKARAVVLGAAVKARMEAAGVTNVLAFFPLSKCLPLPSIVANVRLDRLPVPAGSRGADDHCPEFVVFAMRTAMAGPPCLRAHKSSKLSHQPVPTVVGAGDPWHRMTAGSRSCHKPIDDFMHSCSRSSSLLPPTLASCSYRPATPAADAGACPMMGEELCRSSCHVQRDASATTPWLEAGAPPRRLFSIAVAAPATPRPSRPPALPLPPPPGAPVPYTRRSSTVGQ